MLHYRKWGDKWYKNLIAFSIENPFKTWWKAKKYFKIPHTIIKFSIDKHSFPYASKYWQGKLLDVDIHDVYWKDKWNTPRHERNPLIYICFFGKFSIWISPAIYWYNEFGEKQNESMHYWEYMLNYLYYSKSLKLSSVWTIESKITRICKYGEAEDGSEDKYIPMKIYIPEHLISLNKKGLKEFKKLYEKN